MPFPLSPSRTRFTQIQRDDGNALLSFVAVAPLVALILLAVVQMAAVVWTREIVAELLRQSVTAAARLGGNASTAYSELSSNLDSRGIRVQKVIWSEISLGAGEKMFEVTLEVIPPGISLLPNLTTKVSSSVIVE